MKTLLTFILGFMTAAIVVSVFGGCETITSHVIIGTGERSLTPSRSLGAAKIAFNALDKAAKTRTRVERVTRMRFRDLNLNLATANQDYARILHKVKTVCTKYGKNDTYECIAAMPPVNVGGQFYGGGYSYGICKLGRYSENVSESFGQEENQNGDPRYWHFVNSIAHEACHIRGGGHRKGFNLMNPDALSLVTVGLLPILPKTIQEVKRCVRGL